MARSRLRADTERRLAAALLDLSNAVLKGTAFVYFKRLAPRPLAFMLVRVSTALRRTSLKLIRRNLGR